VRGVFPACVVPPKRRIASRSSILPLPPVIGEPPPWGWAYGPLASVGYKPPVGYERRCAKKETFEPDNVELVGIAAAASRGCGVPRCGTTFMATAPLSR